ncbi:MAG: Gx transporter family protein [Lachnospiraceae bacterium]|nr:Gx transporter family protein [Lachnospiraceae bacterium]
MAFQVPEKGYRNRTKKLAGTALLLAFAMALSYVETLIPLSFGVPGVKLGLPNLAVLLALYLLGTGQAFTVDLLRIVLAGFMFGNMYGILYSLAGGILSFGVMLLFRHVKLFGIGGVSMGGGVFHNIGQLLVAYYTVRSVGLFYYVPVLLCSGVLTGLLIGIIAKSVLPYISHLGGEL